MHVIVVQIARDFVECQSGCFDPRLDVKLYSIKNFNSIKTYIQHLTLLLSAELFFFLLSLHLVTFYRAPYLLSINSSHPAPAFYNCSLTAH